MAAAVASGGAAAAVEQLPERWEGTAPQRGIAEAHDRSAETAQLDIRRLEEAHAKLKATFATGRTKTYEWRLAQLQGINRLLRENMDGLVAALGADLGRPKLEAVVAEAAGVVGDVDLIIANLKEWMRPEQVSHPMTQKPGSSEIIREPKGLILNITPWNFPVCLPLSTLAGIVAAGNCCLLKPSEIAPACERFLTELLPRYLDPEAVIVVTGGVPETQALLALRWDHIVYTGNGTVARIVTKAAAEHLTPCTLELGGKSPTIVLPNANISVAAKRILAGKCVNAGQICIAPDYILAHESVEAKLVAEMQKVLREWYGEDAAKSPDLSRIINGNHFRRLKRLIDSAGDTAVTSGSKPDEETKFIPPTLLRSPRMESAVMQEEIFGPVLPILKVKSVDEIVNHINAGEKPLAMYVFGSGSAVNELLHRTSSGTVCVNDTLFQFANPHLPFGGIGASGCGSYHGRWGFEEFSHRRSVMYRPTWLDPPQRYPPYTDQNASAMQRVLVGPLVPPALKRFLGAAGAAVAAGGAALAMRSRL
eukprot:TRINITY_DN15597_c0_g1_i1.p1 TRINITY_DN15597_c0_g1~~TRINITY_DN15597_c0_g1_i1.p1  ORF type:complete len:536 (-),score=123.54 TRINITY_DN15597_c0_g1_i1:285-1892(-)